MSTPNFELNDPDRVFGNEAAEDEIFETLESYAVARPEIERFVDRERPIQVVRAYKGEGKSALLRLVEARLLQGTSAPLVIKTTGQSVSPQLADEDSDVWVRAWKHSILSLIASEIGARINIALSDDAHTLVEEAERNNFKQRSFVSTIVDRLSSAKVPIARTRPAVSSVEPILRRWLEKGSDVWLIIDDLDQNFVNSITQRLKVATCFIAARQIFNQIPEIKFRLCVRPNVWAILKLQYEALSHLEQYVVDLSWDDANSFEEILARRIEGFLKRTGQWNSTAPKLSQSVAHRNGQLVELLFETPVPWGGETRKRPVHVVLHTLSRHRPRWLIELCKLAAYRAHKARRASIMLDDVLGELAEFGRRRISDTVAEFRSQCPQIESLLIAFADQPERFSTDLLLTAIRDRILGGVNPRIEGVIGAPSPREVAHFLFEIGFLSARRDRPDGSYEHLSYADRPNLLRVTTNVDEGVSWEIHPVFRQTLRLKDVESKSERAHAARRDSRFE